MAIVTDPFGPKAGLHYPAIDVQADLVLVSHEHSDHNCASAVRGSPKVIRGQGEWSTPTTVKGITANHDAKGGSLRGKTTIYVFTVDGVTFCHLGDLGEVPSDDVAKRIGSVDVLMIPVGGIFTIDHEGADAVIALLRPKMVIPMHYWTKFSGLRLDPVDKFTSGKKNVRFEKTNHLAVDRGTLPSSTEIVVLFPPGRDGGN